MFLFVINSRFIHSSINVPVTLMTLQASIKTLEVQLAKYIIIISY